MASKVTWEKQPPASPGTFAPAHASVLANCSCFPLQHPRKFWFLPRAPSCASLSPAAMPGGYKGECGDDVDPMPFLAPPEKERIEAMNKPYDIKRSCWVKDEKEGFVAGEIQSEQGDQVTVKTVTNQVSGE